MEDNSLKEQLMEHKAGLLDFATSGIENAKRNYKDTKVAFTVLSLGVFGLCVLSLLLKALLF